MKEEALKLADKLNGISGHKDNDWNQFNTINKSAQMIRKLVAELDKQGEPVAWMTDKNQIVSNAEKEKYEITYGDFCTPLYTAPQTKPLSDEEIMEELRKVKHTWVATTKVWFEFEKEELLKAIRAIEAKVRGEK